MAPCCRVIARLLKSANSLASPRTREAADAQLQPCASLRGTARPAAGDQRLRGARQQRQGQLLLPGTGGRLRAEPGNGWRPEEHTSELQSLTRISYAGYCLTKKT